MANKSKMGYFDNFSRLWGIGAVPGFLVPGPGALRMGG